MLSASDCLKESGCSRSSGPSFAWRCQARSVRKVSSARERSGCASRHRGPGRGEDRRRGGDDGRHVVVHLERAAEVGRERDPQAGEGARQRWRELDTGVAERLRRPGVGAGHHGEQQREVADVAGHRAADRRGLPLVVERPLRHPAQRRAQADDAAERRGVAQRPAHVGSVGQRDHAGGQRARRAPAGPARGPRRVDGVQRRAEDRVERVRPGRELRDVGLAEDHDAGPADPLDQELVGVGDVVGAQRRAVRRAPAGDRVGVLEREREPVQRAHRGTGRQLLVGRRGTGPGALLVQRDDRVEPGVALGDPGQVQVEQLARGDAARADGVRLVAGGRVDGQVGHEPDFSASSGRSGVLQRLRTSGVTGSPVIPPVTPITAAGRRSRRRSHPPAPGRHRPRSP